MRYAPRTQRNWRVLVSPSHEVGVVEHGRELIGHLLRKAAVAMLPAIRPVVVCKEAGHRDTAAHARAVDSAVWRGVEGVVEVVETSHIAIHCAEHAESRDVRTVIFLEELTDALT